MSRQLVCNRIRTPDGTILQSYNRHDFKVHKDAVTGETYMIDGGLDYHRSYVNEVRATPLMLYSDDKHEDIREGFCWGTRGIDGKQPVTYVPLKDLTTEHIHAILETQYQITDWLRRMFQNELEYRNGI